MAKSVRTLSAILGISMFIFGILKFIDPFKTWYLAQIIESHLPFQTLSFWMGQAGEVVSGLLFIALIFASNKQSKSHKPLFVLTNFLVLGMMVIAIYVHLHPDVPNSVLPLKIKPPFIPGIFFVMAGLNLHFGLADYRSKSKM